MTDENRLIAFDPSSTGTGWAIFEGRRIVKAGVIRRSQARNAPNWAERLAVHVWKLLEEIEPDTVVIEDIGNWKQGAGNRFAWAKAVGIVDGLSVANGAQVHRVTSAWLRGQAFRGKGTDQMRIRLAQGLARQSGAANPAGITSVDAATAVLLGDWHIGRQYAKIRAH